MKKISQTLFFSVIATCLLASASSLRAQTPWAGARATGMGGAQVAAVNDNSATWSNPAALGALKGWELQVLGGFSAQNRNNLVGTLVGVSDLVDDGVSEAELPGLIGGITTLATPGTSVVGSGVIGLVASYGGFAMSIGDVPYTGIYPVIDLQHLVPGGDADNGLAFNETGLYLVGLSAREARVAYGHGFLDGALEVGGALRYVSGVTYFGRCGVLAGEPCEGKDLGELINDTFDQNARTTNKFTFDVGARLNLGLFKLGVVGTSLTQPEFTVADVLGSPGTVPLPRQLRGGLSVSVASFLTLAADGDFIKSDTLAPDSKSQQMSLGAEVKIPLFAFRVGATRDFASVDPTWAYALGLGFGVPVISVDLAVLFGPTGGLNYSNPDREALGASASVRLHF